MTFITATRPAARYTTSIWTNLAGFYDVWRQRQVLKSLSNDALDDIGVSYGAAHTESRRKFWDAPANWRR